MKKFVLALGLTSVLLNADGFMNSIGMEFVKIPSGSFMMGRDPNFEDGSTDELPLHRVRIKSFYMQKTEVTQSQWVRIMGSNPSEFKGRSNPVERVSWYDAKRFIRGLNQREGTNKYRLCTEEEWEYPQGQEVIQNTSLEIATHSLVDMLGIGTIQMKKPIQ